MSHSDGKNAKFLSRPRHIAQWEYINIQKSKKIFKGNKSESPQRCLTFANCNEGCYYSLLPFTAILWLDVKKSENLLTTAWIHMVHWHTMALDLPLIDLKLIRNMTLTAILTAQLKLREGRLHSRWFFQIKKKVKMADVDFNLSDVSVISPENDVFVLVFVSSLSLLGNYNIYFQR